jgi:tripartite-type tricarboxylate transporter receptor subunit TctC
VEISRRKLLSFAAGAAVLPALRTAATAQSYPNKPVRIIVGQAAGSSSDIQARLIAQRLSERLRQQFVVESRPGAAGNLATETVARTAADGYTLLLVNTSNVIAPALYEKLNFDFRRDIAPIAGIARVALVMEVNPSFPTRSVPEFIAYAKTNPGKLNMGSAGIGSPHHLSGELFKFMAGVEMTHVPYRGSTPAITDLLGGQVDVLFDVTPTALPQVRSGKLKALAVTSAERLAELPDVPAIGEFLKGYEATAWTGMGAPKNTPSEVLAILNKEINAALADPEINKRLAELGATVFARSATEFGRYIADETEKWGKVIRFAGIKPE